MTFIGVNNRILKEGDKVFCIDGEETIKKATWLKGVIKKISPSEIKGYAVKVTVAVDPDDFILFERCYYIKKKSNRIK